MAHLEVVALVGRSGVTFPAACRISDPCFSEWRFDPASLDRLTRLILHDASDGRRSPQGERECGRSGPVPVRGSRKTLRHTRAVAGLRTHDSDDVERLG